MFDNTGTSLVMWMLDKRNSAVLKSALLETLGMVWD